MKDKIIIIIEIILILNIIAAIVAMLVLNFNNNDTFKQRLKAFYLKIYREYFMRKINDYPVPEGNKLYEMDLITMDIHKAEYKISNGNRIFVKKPNCIYDYAPSLHEVKPKFQALIDKSLKRI